VPVFLSRGPDGLVTLKQPGGSNEDGVRFGPSFYDIGPGWRVLGRTYEEWADLPDGMHLVSEDVDIDDDYAPRGRRGRRPAG
jgi:hypothetical protein